MALAKLKTQEPALVTVADYLEIERDAPERSEYIDGEIYSMAGESDFHGLISVNLVGVLYSQLKGKDCSVRTKETKVKTGGFSTKSGSSTKGMFSYPDVLIVCGEVKYHDKFKDVILNPRVVIEVLSPSTEIFDRNDKFSRYRMFNDTLNDYILVSQDKPMIEHFIRQKDNSWVLYAYIGLDKTCTINSVGCRLKLSEVYDRISFSKEVHKFLKEIERAK
ncbi:MAG: Uma2 family endonuclease [Pyrinomonadaceae bacterium]